MRGGRQQGAGRRAAERQSPATPKRILVGVRLEPRLVKVMKGLAELRDVSLGELIEEVFMAAMEGSNAFAEKGGRLSAETRQRIAGLKQVYGLDYTLAQLHDRRRA
ncbi:MAG: hypothetical protein N2111_11925 [Candidatus Sumerlaeaceae bacterium]|nr:hypothetical protein [Candidatus Sumerlaeaceae bacterium]